MSVAEPRGGRVAEPGPRTGRRRLDGWPDARPPGTGRARRGQPLEEGPVGVERGGHPLGAGDGVDGEPAGRWSRSRGPWRRRPGARPPGPAARGGCARAGRRWARTRLRWRSGRRAGGRRPSAIGPCCWIRRARSPRNGIPWKGSGSAAEWIRCLRHEGHRMRVAPEPTAIAAPARGGIVVTGAAGGARPTAWPSHAWRRRLAVVPVLIDLPRRGRCAGGATAVDLLTDDLKARVDGAATGPPGLGFGAGVDEDPDGRAAGVTSSAPGGCSTPPAPSASGHVVVLSQRHRLRRLGQQPGAADRGRPAAPDPGPGLRRAEGRDRAPDLAEWRDQHPGVTVTVLRPAPAVADDSHAAGWPAPCRTAGGAPRRRRPARRSSSTSTTWPPPSMLAATRAARRRLQRGPRRLAHAEPSLRELAGRHRPRSACPERLRRPGGPAALAAAAWRRTPPGRRAPTPAHPWVVANDRLEADGLGADAHQRGGLRRWHAGRRPGHAQPPPPPGAGARRHRRRLAAGVGAAVWATVRRARQTRASWMRRQPSAAPSARHGSTESRIPVAGGGGVDGLDRGRSRRPG